MSYTHFTTEERKNLQDLMNTCKSIRQIANYLGRNPSSVSREIKRNQAKTHQRRKTNPYCYHYWRATVCAIVRRKNQRKIALPEESEVRAYVIEKLNLFWSPEQIAATWRIKHPESRLCHATIYRYIKRGDLPHIKAKTHLRRRGKNKNLVHHNSAVIKPDLRIPDWPEEIVKRLREGDWEGDTLYGGVGKGGLITLVDRKHRILVAKKINSRDSAEVRDAIVSALDGMPVRSISLDNGSEFADFRALGELLQVPIFFAEPHKPWQRGTNENTNGLLRFFFPKGFDFRTVSDEDVQAVVDLINDRPRKTLGWISPKDAFFSVALT